MKKCIQIQKDIRSKSKPTHVSTIEWANSVNWTIEAWKCHLSGQKWVHSFTICCPEQYALLTDENGRFILENVKDLRFSTNLANRLWMNRLEAQIQEMKANDEWLESIAWSRLLDKIRESFPEVIVPQTKYPTKRVVKGHRLIRIKVAA
jgi:hypothetical protein